MRPGGGRAIATVACSSQKYHQAEILTGACGIPNLPAITFPKMHHSKPLR
jgi:hypothetical protein